MSDNKTPVYVTKSFLPPREEYDRLLDEIWSNDQLTNNGPLSKRFEKEVSDYLHVDAEKFTFVANGTLALQLALEALDIRSGEIITTPFTYVATTSSILWQRCTPMYVDIDPNTLTIDVNKIEQAITDNTKAILAVHVFGNPCDIEAIQRIADTHGLKVIYDAAHAFGVTYKGKSILEYGDISTLSFHATKLFHTIEGGAVYCKDQNIAEKIELSKRFGHNGDTHIQLGINAKANEFQAAIGIVNLRYIDEIIDERKELSDYYDQILRDYLEKPTLRDTTEYNYAYYPVLAKNETHLESILTALAAENIYPRRYFYPSLNKLPYLENNQNYPVSEDIASRIICLPFYPGITKAVMNKICEVIKGLESGVTSEATS